jgi:hypothetical protein
MFYKMSKHTHYTDLLGFRVKVGHTSEKKIVCKRRSVFWASYSGMSVQMQQRGTAWVLSELTQRTLRSPAGLLNSLQGIHQQGRKKQLKAISKDFWERSWKIRSRTRGWSGNRRWRKRSGDFILFVMVQPSSITVSLQHFVNYFFPTRHITYTITATV